QKTRFFKKVKKVSFFGSKTGVFGPTFGTQPTLPPTEPWNQGTQKPPKKQCFWAPKKTSTRNIVSNIVFDIKNDIENDVKNRQK
ncbi:MAG: hypothetical protein OEY01_17035, partial [Desulfobulbaceae bacterium]|nr:hypothetical protein [Desulfobulbaceae bacterium]